MYYAARGLLKYFEKFCNLKKQPDIIEAIVKEASFPAPVDQYSERQAHLASYFRWEMDQTTTELYKTQIEIDKTYYFDCLAAFQKMARQVAENKPLVLTSREGIRLNDMLNFTIPTPRLEFAHPKMQNAVPWEVYYPSFMPKGVMFPILSFGTWFLCEITKQQMPYTLTTCGFVVPLADQEKRKPCGKILLQHNRGRQRKWCLLHRTYRSKRKKRAS